LYTSYFAKLRKLDTAIIPVAICAKVPDWYTGLQYKKLAPKYSFFSKWKIDHDNEYYIQHFYEEVLNKLDAKTVLKELYDLAQRQNKNFKDIMLICYEKPEDFCHRHIVSEWFQKSGIVCSEYMS